VKVFNNYFNKTKDKTSLFQPESEDPSITPLRILSKPKPGYTDSARQSNTTGTIRLAIYFSSKGTIDYILVLKPLQNGLTENAIKAARGIKFEPQMKDGKPVSVIKIVEYSFTIY
jgi:TonB family protein